MYLASDAAEKTLKAGKPLYKGEWQYVRNPNRGSSYYEHKNEDGTVHRLVFYAQTTYAVSNRLRNPARTANESGVELTTSHPDVPMRYSTARLFTKRNRGEDSVSRAEQEVARQRIVERAAKQLGITISTLDFAYR
jgi:hypothetical protein